MSPVTVPRSWSWPGGARARAATSYPGSRYRDADTGLEHEGAVLMHQGLRLPSDAAFGFGSALVRLDRAGGPG